MEGSATIFVALGAIIAALITGGVAFVNLIISKDQKVSEFRQVWIDELRKDISEFIGYTSKYSAYVNQRKEELSDEHKHNEALTGVADFIYKEVHKVGGLFNKIILRLNPKDDKLIINKIKEIEDCYSNVVGKLGDTEKIAELNEELRELSQSLLKKEWKRVKRGELSFMITKYSALALLVGLILLGFYYKDDLCSLIKKDRPPVMEIQPPNKAIQRTRQTAPPISCVRQT